MNLYTRTPLYIIAVNALSSVIILAKNQHVAKTMLLFSEILHIKTYICSIYPPPRPPVASINVVHYKLSPNLIEQIRKHETVQKADDHYLNNDW